MSITACATAVDDGDAPANARDKAFELLQRTSGAPVNMELNEAGVTRIVAMTPRFPVATHATDVAQAATNFLAAHHDLFELDATDATSFTITRVDAEPERNMSHVTFQRTFNGIPVWQGAITVHMDGGNGVFRALGDEFYRISAPSNRVMLSPDEAALAAGRAVGASLSLTAVPAESQDAQGATFTAPGTLDPVKVDPQIVQLSDTDSRFAYRVLLSRLDDQKQQQYDLILVDAADGTPLGVHSLVNTFTGKVFNVNAQPTATLATDTRTEQSFDGDPTASPLGWVTTPGNKTIGNNAVAATDIDGNNTVGTNETQPTAVNNAFDFPFNPAQNAQNFRPAAVTNAFFLVNDYHDRTYKLGFTEASGNFQTNNNGKGGAANDPVNVDAQDGSGTNNANFSTPPDGQRPRMQMFIFSLKNGAGGVTQDGDFDPSVIYHENTHGVSNRLVGGGSTNCLGGLQSGGMGEGWGDFMGSSFLNNPIVGAYVTGNATRGIRQFAMNASPFTYNDVKNGTLAEVHNVGELWAATLWDVRTSVGDATTQQLVISGMKLTPCNPTMLNARDAIIQADANLNAGANRCKIWAAFAGRQMGTGASSPNANSTTAIVTSTTVPADCNGGGGGGTTVFSDDFETDKGWTVNPSATDTATTGKWERGIPQATTSGGTQQVGTPTSGTHDLVTGASAGTAVGDNDIDGGTTSIRSPAIAIPATGTTTLTFKSYFAHLNNSSSADFLRVQVVGTTTTTVFQVTGTAAQVNGAFASHSANISSFAGQTVRILISAADAAGASLVEAGVDDVLITNQ
ncbi:MAG TPA: extracellular metalloproteinase [Kofleriaceae bacterium]|nr:extracellular metalloproteinase [Kofleriaceae bacterium]